MSDDIKPEVIRRTQDSLGKYIKKPPLTEKLLKKPPFRFLHDIITAVIRETGFLKDLFTAEELNHENIKDRDGKVAFLQKLIDAIKTIVGANLMVRATKIVAGHEPTRTNELLQAMGKALDKKLSSVEYVQSLQNKGGKKTRSTSREQNAAKTTKSTVASKSSTQVRNQSQDRGKSKDPDKKRTTSKSSGDRVPKVKTEVLPPPQEEKPAPAPAPPPEESEQQPPPAVEPAPPPPPPQAQERPHSARPGHRKSSANVTRAPPEPVDDVKPPPDNAELKPDTKEEAQILGSPPQPAEVAVLGAEPSKLEHTVPRSARPQTGLRPQTAPRPQSARPPSARPAAPRIRDRGEVRIAEEASVSPIGKVHVITENEAITEQDEDDNFIVVETQATVVAEEQPPTPPVTTDLKPVEDGQHGHLVAQILETQKELEDDGRQAGQPKKVEIEWEAGRRRERELAGREIDRLRGSIQTLTRAANPLGKLMDFLQEDVDSMQRELDMWRRTNVELLAQLRLEETQTQQLTEPMKMHLQQLEQSIQEQLNQMSAVKATVLRNDQRINSLLTGASSSK